MSARSGTEKSNTSSFTPPKCVGLYRDGNYLVVDEELHRFPLVCLKTGVKTDETIDVEDKYLPIGSPKAIIWCILLGALGYALAKKEFGTPVELTVPLDSNFKDRATHGSTLPWVGVFWGVVAIVVGLFRAVSHWSGTIISMSGFAFTIVMLIVAYLQSQKATAPFTVWKLSPGFIWLKGVNRNVLARFPTWDEELEFVQPLSTRKK